MNDQRLEHILNYLLSVQLNVNVNPTVGEASNQQLRALFMDLLEEIQPRAFFDIGARDGESATAVRRRVPGCRAYAFEANPRIFAQFAASNAEAELIDYRNLALSNHLGSIELHVPTLSTEVMVGEHLVSTAYAEPADTGRSSILRRTDRGAEYDTFVVPTSTLDQFCVDEQIAYLSPTAAWIDVEGAASLVIEGAREALGRCAIVFVEVEGHAFWKDQSSCGSVVDSLIAAGFVPVARDREYHDKQFNVLLVRPEYLHLLAHRLYDMNSAIQQSKRLNVLHAAGGAEPSQAPAPAQVGKARQPRHRNLIPVLVPVFNNPTFLRNMLEQLADLGCENVTVMDNGSTYPPMLAYLDSLGTSRQVLRLGDNAGPRRIFADPVFYASLPRLFCATDPDLQFNPDMPTDFVERLLALSEEHREGKVGLALRIDDSLELNQDTFEISGARYRIAEWEGRFWQETVEPDVYRAQIDTTFALYNKSYFDPADPLRALRVAGPFACVHLPWLANYSLPQEEADYYRQSNRHSFYLPNAEHGPPPS